MSKIDMWYYSELKEKFMREKKPEVEKLGYGMACGLFFVGEKETPNVSCRQEGLERKVGFGVRLWPLHGSPDPIEGDVLARIKHEIITDNYNGVPLDIRYVSSRLRKE